jgi:hypothetical protein
MDAEYTSAMWMDASVAVGVAARHITISTMKYFIALLLWGTSLHCTPQRKNQQAHRKVSTTSCLYQQLYIK